MIPVKGGRLRTTGILSYGFQRTPTHRHQGLDFPAPRGTPVLAPEPGTVLKTVHGYAPGFRGYGKSVVLWSAGPGRYHLFAHLDSILVREGDRVKAGDQLGTVGATAYRDRALETTKSGAYHLHYEVSSSPYPKASEAARLDPVTVLRELARADGNRVLKTGAAIFVFGLVALAAAFALN